MKPLTADRQEFLRSGAIQFFGANRAFFIMVSARPFANTNGLYK